MLAMAMNARRRRTHDKLAGLPGVRPVRRPVRPGADDRFDLYYVRAGRKSTHPLLLIPGGLLMGLLGPRIGRAYDRVGARPLVVPGSIGLTLSLALFALLVPHVGPWVVLALHMLLSLSLSLLFTPLFTAGLGALPQQPRHRDAVQPGRIGGHGNAVAQGVASGDLPDLLTEFRRDEKLDL